MITKLLRTVFALLLLAGVGFAIIFQRPAPHTIPLRSPVLVTQPAMFYAGSQVAEAELRAGAEHAAHAAHKAHASRPAAPTARSTPSLAPSAQPSYAAVAVPDPGSAQRIAYDLLPSYGFDQGASFTCLVYLWDRESGWRYNAQEPTSGAYGIPQSLPASKMAMFGSDYLTDPTTQIRWGLWYIKATYGTPCNAWNHDSGDGWY